MKSLKVSTWLLISFLILVQVPLLGIGIFSIRIYRKSLEQIVITNLAQIADKKTDQIENYIRERLTDVIILSQAREVKETVLTLTRELKKSGYGSRSYQKSTDFATRALVRYSQSYPAYDLFLMDASGNVLYSLAKESDLGTNLINGPYRDSGLALGFQRAMRYLPC